MKFNKRLRERRRELNFTQKEVAEMIGISERAYQHYETGSREPNIENLLLLSFILDISIDNLLCRDDFIHSREAFSDEY